MGPYIYDTCDSVLLAWHNWTPAILIKNENITHRPAYICCLDSMPLATISRTLGAWKGFCRLDDKHSTMPKSKLLPSKFCLIQSFTTRLKYLPGWEKSSWDRCCASVCRAAGPPRWSTSRSDTRLWRHTRALHWMVFILERKAENAVCFSNSYPTEFHLGF